MIHHKFSFTTRFGKKVIKISEKSDKKYFVYVLKVYSQLHKYGSYMHGGC